MKPLENDALSMNTRNCATSCLTLLVFAMTFSLPSTPSSINLWVAIYAALVLLTIAFIGYASYANQLTLRMSRISLSISILYLAAVGVSATVSLLAGESLLQVLRSTAPFLLFVPFCFLRLGNTGEQHAQRLALPIIAAGIMQSILIFATLYLLKDQFGSFAALFADTKTRVTTESRACSPFILGALILPIPLMIQQRHWLPKLLWATVITCALYGILITQIRAIILLLPIVFCLMLWMYCRQGKARQYLQNLSLVFCVFLFASCLLPSDLILESNYDRLQLVVTGIHNKLSGDSGPLTHQTDFSHGRVVNEWIPVFKTWVKQDLGNKTFGIGLGKPFLTSQGMPRRYTHNLPLFFLLYGGIVGLVVSLAFHGSISNRFCRLALRYRDPLVLSFGVLHIALFGYAMLFAVYKLLSFNLMLFCLLSVLFFQPDEPSPAVHS